MPRFEEEKQKEKLEVLRRKEEEEATRFLASKYGIPYLNLKITPVDAEALKVISVQESQKALLAVFGARGKNIDVAVVKPDREETVRLLNNLKEKGFKPNLFLVSRSSLQKVWTYYKEITPEGKKIGGHIEVDPSRIAFFKERAKSLEELVENLKKLPKGEISEVLELLLAGGLALEASDLHFEPEEKGVRLRYRFDGVLQEFDIMGHAEYKFILSRIKLISGLKLNIRSQAQDGRFTIRTTEGDIEVRTSTIPGPYGEGIVLRILNPKTLGISFNQLGMGEELRALLEHELQKPDGMILTTGPTGSGKTTTLYTFIKKILTPDVKIITIEDPIEYHLPGISQTQVDTKHGYSFAEALRSILRHDPDIILVGEIRDLETAETALHAALTGHLVFSTLHTNDAVGTIPRLIDMGARPPIIAPAINVAMAQRLVRRICQVCRKAEKAKPEEKDEIQRVLANLPKSVKKGRYLAKLADLRLWRTQGCPECHNTGYRGRIGIFEAFRVDDELERIILASPAEADIREAGRNQGMITMYEDGILKVVDGITTLEELKRIAGEQY